MNKKNNMIKVSIISSLSVALYFATKFESDTLKYIVFTSAIVGIITTLIGTKKY